MVQGADLDHRGMDHVDPAAPDIDKAIDTATRRVGEAQEEFVTEPPESPDLVPKAELVEHFAEDLHELAGEAAAATDEGDPERTEP